MPRKKRKLSSTSKEDKKREKLVRAFLSILEEWGLSPNRIAFLDFVQGYILVKDDKGTFYISRDVDMNKEMYPAIMANPPEKGMMKKFDKDGKEDRFA